MKTNNKEKVVAVSSIFGAKNGQNVRFVSQEAVIIASGEVIALILALLLGSGFFSIYERKVLAELQRRWGPNRAGFAGTLQPIADGLKLLLKEIVIPRKAKKIVFLSAPVLGAMPVGLCWLITPFGDDETIMLDLEFGLLYLTIFISLSLYNVVLGGWAANSSYPILGAARAGSQFISYELTGTFIFLIVGIAAGSFNFSVITGIQESIWLVIPLLPFFLIAIISSIAETNRPPFDLPEAESELVAGYQTEHSAFLFASFVIMEHALLIQSAYILSVLFLGGAHLLGFVGNTILIMKVQLVLTILIVTRAILPRYRYDQLIEIGWKVLLPLALAGLVVITAFGYDTEDYLLGLTLFGGWKKSLGKQPSSQKELIKRNLFSREINVYKYNHPQTPFYSQIEMIGESEEYIDGTILLAISEKGETPLFLGYREKMMVMTRSTKLVRERELAIFTYEQLVDDWTKSDYMLFERVDEITEIFYYERSRRTYKLPIIFNKSMLTLNIGFAIVTQDYKEVRPLCRSLFEISHDFRWESSGTRLIKGLAGIAVLARHSDDHFWMVCGYLIDGPEGVYYLPHWQRTDESRTDPDLHRKTRLFRIVQRISKGQSSLFMINFDVKIEEDPTIPY